MCCLEWGIKGACVERPLLPHQAAVIWHHLLLQGAEAYREGMPVPQAKPPAMYVSHMPSLLHRALQEEKNDSSVGSRQRDNVMSG